MVNVTKSSSTVAITGSAICATLWAVELQFTMLLMIAVILMMMMIMVVRDKYDNNNDDLVRQVPYVVEDVDDVQRRFGNWTMEKRENTPETCLCWSDIKQKPVTRDHLWPACKCALKLLKSMAGFRNDPVTAWSWFRWITYVHFLCRSSPAVRRLPMNSTPVKMWSPVLKKGGQEFFRKFIQIGRDDCPLVWTFVIIVTAGDELILGWGGRRRKAKRVLVEPYRCGFTAPGKLRKQ